MAKFSSKKIVSGVIVVVCVGIIYILRASSGIWSSRTAADVAALPHSKGNPKASIKITEFADFQCPACAEGAKYLKGLMKTHPQAIYLEMKYFPLQMHQHAYLSARYAECAAWQDRFWPFHDHLFERQANWRKLTDPQPAFEVIAKDVNLDLAQLKECLADPAVSEFIDKRKAEGEALGVRSTPTYYVNGKMVVGAKPLQLEMDKLLGGQKN